LGTGIGHRLTTFLFFYSSFPAFKALYLKLAKLDELNPAVVATCAPYYPPIESVLLISVGSPLNRMELSKALSF